MENERRIEPVNKLELSKVVSNYSDELQPFISEYLDGSVDEMNESFDYLAEDDSPTHNPQEIDENDDAPNLPDYLPRQIRKVISFNNNFTAKNNRMPSIKEICMKFGITPQKAIELEEVAFSQSQLFLEDIKNDLGEATIDLNEEFDDPDDKLIPLEDLISDPNEADIPENAISDLFFTDSLKKYMSSRLSDKESRILKHRYGLEDTEPIKLRYFKDDEQLDEDLRLSAERIRQLEARALMKLRRPNNPMIINKSDNYEDDDNTLQVLISSPNPSGKLISDIIRLNKGMKKALVILVLFRFYFVSS